MCHHINSDYEKERNRLTADFRNSGVYYFTKDPITFNNDTTYVDKSVDTEYEIKNRRIRNEDSVVFVPFKIYKIKKVNIITDETSLNQRTPFSDSLVYKNYNLYSHGKMRYRPKALVDAVFIN